jgi:hypothetical protein
MRRWGRGDLNFRIVPLCGYSRVKVLERMAHSLLIRSRSRLSIEISDLQG